MPYSTKSDIEKKLPPQQLIQLSDDDNDLLPDTGVIDEAIAGADSEIDGYVALRYTVPLSPVPALIKTLSINIAIKNLHDRRGIDRETVRLNYKHAVALLQKIAESKMNLGDTPGPAESETGSPASSTTPADGRTFSKDTLNNY